MASKLLGRAICPLKCGHDAAHVKIKTDKENGRSAYPYVYCPGCGFMGHTKTDEQARALAALTRPEKSDSPPVPVPAPTPTPTGNPDPVDEPVAAPTPTSSPAPAKPVAAPPAKPAGLFDLFREVAK